MYDRRTTASGHWHSPTTAFVLWRDSWPQDEGQEEEPRLARSPTERRDDGRRQVPHYHCPSSNTNLPQQLALALLEAALRMQDTVVVVGSRGQDELATVA